MPSYSVRVRAPAAGASSGGRAGHSGSGADPARHAAPTAPASASASSASRWPCSGTTPPSWQRARTAAPMVSGSEAISATRVAAPRAASMNTSMTASKAAVSAFCAGGQSSMKPDGVVAALEDRGEHLAQGRRIEPEVGVDVERVCDGHAIAQQPAQGRAAAAPAAARNPEPRSRATSAVIAMSPPEAPMTSDLRAAGRTAVVEDLERLAERAQGFAARDARLPAECVEHRVGAGERSCVAVRGARGRRRPSGLDDGDRFAGGTRPGRGRGEAARIADAFQVQAEGGDPRIVAQDVDQVLDGDAGLIADREQVADRQRAVVEHQGQRDRPALANQRDAALGRRADHLVGHHGHAVEIIHEAVAIRTEVGQRAGALLAVRPSTAGRRRCRSRRIRS